MTGEVAEIPSSGFAHPVEENVIHDLQGLRAFAHGLVQVVFEPDARTGYGKRQLLYRFPPDSIIIGLEWRGNESSSREAE